MQAHLDGGATTLCRCWRLTRADGAVFGFTDHDRDLSVDGTLFEAQAGFEATEMVSTLGLGVDNLDAAGALTSERLSEQALAAGLFDNATVEIFIVNWADTAQILLVRSGNLGEVTRSDYAFKAEIRGLAHVLNQPLGRVFQFPCHADLGDARCGVDLENPSFKTQATVADVLDRRSFSSSDLGAFADGWFTRGTVTWTSGANAGRGMEIKSHRLSGSLASIDLWQPMSEPIAVGDAFEIRAGCDKQFSTCNAKFANGVNFRGFPHMPGNDFVLSYPVRGEGVNDGGSLNK
jgi:uncharacterized phage protein (TIGR02218 family)